MHTTYAFLLVDIMWQLKNSFILTEYTLMRGHQSDPGETGQAL